MSEDAMLDLPPGGICVFADRSGVPMFPSEHLSSHPTDEFVASPFTLPDGTETIALHCIHCLAPLAVIEQRVATTLVPWAKGLNLDLFAYVVSRPVRHGRPTGPFVVALWEQYGFDLKAYHPDMPWASGPRRSSPLVCLLAQHEAEPQTLGLLLEGDWGLAEISELMWELQHNIGAPAHVREIFVHLQASFADIDGATEAVRLVTDPEDDRIMRAAWSHGPEGVNSHYFRPVAYATNGRFLDEGWAAFEIPPAPRPNPYFARPRVETLGDRAGGLSCREHARKLLVRDGDQYRPY